MSWIMFLAILGVAIGLTTAFAGLPAGLAVAVAAALGSLFAMLRQRNPMYGAGVGLVLSIVVVSAIVITDAKPPRCDFGDPIDMPTLTHPAGYVYVLQDTEFSKRYKIGRTNDAARRLREIRNALPGESEIVAIVDTQDAPTLEWQLHQRYAESRKRGEWFDLADSQVRELCRI